MLVKESNMKKINEMIKKAEGRATTRTIEYKDIAYNIEDIEKTLGIPKKDMIGIVAYVDSNAQNFPNAYKYTPYSTQYTLERKASGWDLVAVKRGRTERRNRKFRLVLTDVAKEAIIISKEWFE